MTRASSLLAISVVLALVSGPSAQAQPGTTYMPGSPQLAHQNPGPDRKSVV